MPSEKSLKTGHFVRSQPNASRLGNKGAAKHAVHYVAIVVPDKPMQTACLRTGRFLHYTEDTRIAMIEEENANGRYMRVTEYRTLTTCKHCTSGEIR